MEHIMKYLACALDSENYTSPWFAISENKKEAFWKMESTIDPDYHMDNEEHKSKYDRYTYQYLDNDNDWIVMEIHEIIQHPYYLVYYHAYDGVDFSVQGFNTLEEAQKEMEKQFLSVIDEDEEDDEEIKDGLSDFSAIYDTGSEWLMWRIVEEKSIEVKEEI